MELCSSDDEETTKKYAVVIANSKYDEDALEASEPSKKWNGSPSFDARMMLRKLGLRNFEVSDFHDQTGEALKKTFSDFVAAFHGRQLKPSAEKEVCFLCSTAATEVTGLFILRCCYFLYAAMLCSNVSFLNAS